MIYQGLSGRTYNVDENKIASGGEGVIYPIIGDGRIVAKIFKESKRDSQREKKLKRMIQTKLSSEQLEQITWPLDVIYDRLGFAGYVMPALHDTESLTAVYSEERYTLQERITVAYNLCAAIDTVHSAGQICGDMNPQNICVNLKGGNRQYHVTLVDTDSYHIITPDETYRCEVGLPDYLAPEIQQKLKNGQDLKNVPLPTYTRDTDLFSLAVHIFTLLMNGCHPFACAKKISPRKDTIKRMESGSSRESVVAPQPIENIRDGFFPFAEERAGIMIPIYAPGFSSLPAQVQYFFKQTFIDGYRHPKNRPTAQAWMEILGRLGGMLVECPEGHQYFRHCFRCPICEVYDRMKQIMEPGFGVKDDDGQGTTVTGGQETTVTGGQKTTGNENKGDPFHEELDPLFGPRWLSIMVITILVVIMSMLIYYASESKKIDSSDKGADVSTYENRNTYDSLEEKEEDLEKAAEEKLEEENLKKVKVLLSQAKQLYRDGRLKKALAKVNEGIHIDFDDYKTSTEILDLKNKIDYKIRQKEIAAKKRKKEKEKEKKIADQLNQIIKAIKDKDYKKAGDLTVKYSKKDNIEDYAVDKDINSIYIKNGKVVDMIKSGKGFMLSVYYGVYSYYGAFNNGKMSGKGVEVGEDAWGHNYYAIGWYEKNKLNGGAEIIRWDQKLGGDKYTTKTSGPYKNNKENGNMKVTYYNSSGSVYHNYYYTAKNGSAVCIEVTEDGEYAWAKTSDGEHYLWNKKKDDLKDWFVNPRYEW